MSRWGWVGNSYVTHRCTLPQELGQQLGFPYGGEDKAVCSGWAVWCFFMKEELEVILATSIEMP